MTFITSQELKFFFLDIPFSTETKYLPASQFRTRSQNVRPQKYKTTDRQKWKYYVDNTTTLNEHYTNAPTVCRVQDPRTKSNYKRLRLTNFTLTAFKTLFAGGDFVSHPSCTISRFSEDMVNGDRAGVQSHLSLKPMTVRCWRRFGSTWLHVWCHDPNANNANSEITFML